MTGVDPSAEVWTVSALAAALNQVVKTAFSTLWVEGEITGLRQPASGHLYFTLKDQNAAISAVMWRSTAMRLPFRLADGMHVLANVEPEIYPQRGQLQVMVRKVTPQGVGPLELAFRQLRERLNAEGLFAVERKRTLPRFLRRIVLITSPSGAAVRDFLEVAGRRWLGTEIVLVPASVQGERAPGELIAALSLASRLDVEAIVLVRGGGSLEDLWSFNDEGLARAIFASPIPVVTGVGHEIDVTIADLVADVRALTPSEAAERLFPDGTELRRQLSQLERRSVAGIIGGLGLRWQRVNNVARSTAFRDPLREFRLRAQRIDDAERSLLASVQQRLAAAAERLSGVERTIAALSPLNVLERGYALATKPDGTLVTDAADVAEGDEVVVRLASGRLKTRVTAVETSDGSQ